MADQPTITVFISRCCLVCDSDHIRDDGMAWTKGIPNPGGGILADMKIVWCHDSHLN